MTAMPSVWMSALHDSSWSSGSNNNSSGKFMERADTSTSSTEILIAESTRGEV